MRKATKGQLALIHVAKAKLNLDDDTYRDILWVQAHVESAKDLDEIGVERVLQRFRELGFHMQGDQDAGDGVIQFRPKVRYATPGPIASQNSTGAELPTSNQQALIRHLFEDLGWHDRKRQMMFTARQCGGSPFPDRRQASALIETLKKMVARGYSERVVAAATPASDQPPAAR